MLPELEKNQKKQDNPVNQNRLFKRLRQACQLLFLVLFRLTNYSGADTISYAVNIFFRWDPLVGDEPLRGSLDTRALTTPGCCISSRYRRRHGGSEPSHHRA